MQCAYLLSSIVGGWLHSAVPAPTAADCGALLRDLNSVSDLVATTERLFGDLGWLDATFALGLNETLRLWSSSNRSVNARAQGQKARDVQLARQQALDPAVSEKVRASQSLDQEMYECARSARARHEF